MIRKRADAFGCLAIAFIGALFVSYLLLGLSLMADLADETQRLPLWNSAARAMAFCFGPALILSTLMAARPHRLPVFLTGLAIAVAIYVVVGFAWWFRFPL